MILIDLKTEVPCGEKHPLARDIYVNLVHAHALKIDASTSLVATAPTSQQPHANAGPSLKAVAQAFIKWLNA